MKYLRKFENINDEDFRNKILLVDSSASFIYDFKDILKNKNLYLSDNFTVLFCGGFGVDVIENTTLEDIYLKIKNLRSAGGDNMQDGIDYIIDKKLKGSVLVISDGFFSINISKLPNDISVLYTDTKPYIIGGECQLFYKDFSSDYYPPRDCNSIEEYNTRKIAKKYNL